MSSVKKDSSLGPHEVWCDIEKFREILEAEQHALGQVMTKLELCESVMELRDKLSKSVQSEAKWMAKDLVNVGEIARLKKQIQRLKKQIQSEEKK